MEITTKKQILNFILFIVYKKSLNFLSCCEKNTAKIQLCFKNKTCVLCVLCVLCVYLHINNIIPIVSVRQNILNCSLNAIRIDTKNIFIYYLFSYTALYNCLFQANNFIRCKNFVLY